MENSNFLVFQFLNFGTVLVIGGIAILDFVQRKKYKENLEILKANGLYPKWEQQNKTLIFIKRISLVAFLITVLAGLLIHLSDNRTLFMVFLLFALLSWISSMNLYLRAARQVRSLSNSGKSFVQTEIQL